MGRLERARQATGLRRFGVAAAGLIPRWPAGGDADKGRTGEESRESDLLTALSTGAVGGRYRWVLRAGVGRGAGGADGGDDRRRRGWWIARWKEPCEEVIGGASRLCERVSLMGEVVEPGGTRRGWQQRVLMPPRPAGGSDGEARRVQVRRCHTKPDESG